MSSEGVSGLAVGAFIRLIELARNAVAFRLNDARRRTAVGVDVIVGVVLGWVLRGRYATQVTPVLFGHSLNRAAVRISVPEAMAAGLTRTTGVMLAAWR